VPRRGKARRETKETKVAVEVDLDGEGKAEIKTPIPFLDHMLEALANHSLIDISLKAEGDVEVGLHHTVEDVGFVLGLALKEAWGDRRGVRRFGHAIVPMDDALALVAVDLSGRAHFEVDLGLKRRRADGFPCELAEEFLRALSRGAEINLHAVLLRKGEPHHSLEAIFKALALALRWAVEVDPRREGVPSTKGALD